MAAPAEWNEGIWAGVAFVRLTFAEARRVEPVRVRKMRRVKVHRLRKQVDGCIGRNTVTLERKASHRPARQDL